MIKKNSLLRRAQIYLNTKLSESKKNKERWAGLKNKFKGKRVFLIGNGPSLNITPLYLLKDEYTMSFNHFNLFFERLNWIPNFYVCDDLLVGKDMRREINKKIIPRVDYAIFPGLHNSGATFKTFILPKKNVLWYIHKAGSKYPCFYPGFPYTGSRWTVAYIGLEVLVYLGFSEIYLVGTDMDYKIHTTAKVLKGRDIQSTKDDDPNHFDPRYFGKGKKYHQPEAYIIKNFLDSMALANEEISKTNTKVFNATHGGKLETFKRIDFQSLFNHISSEKRETLFNELIKNNVKDLDKKLCFLKNPENKITKESFICSQDKVNEFIKVYIYSHIPYGPYNFKYYFIKRDVV